MQRNNNNSRLAGVTLRVVVMALLVALQIVLSRILSINLPFLKIGFSFLPIMVAAYIYGPAGGVIVATVSDLIGAITINTQGTFFPGFTVTAALVGFIYGMCLRGKISTVKIAVGIVIKEVLCSLVLNTAWLSIMYHSSFGALAATRIWQVLAMIVVETVIADILFNRMTAMKKLRSELNTKYSKK